MLKVMNHGRERVSSDRKEVSAPHTTASSSDEAISWRHDTPLKRIRCQIDRVEMRGTAMNSIVATVLKSSAAEARADLQPFTVVALFCSVGLLAALCFASLGFDVSGELF